MIKKLSNKQTFGILLIIIGLLKPGTGNGISTQSSYLTQEMLVLPPPLNKQRIIVLENYFESIISISKSRVIKPVIILFNSDNIRKSLHAKKSL